MNELTSSESSQSIWREVRPVLDDTMHALSDGDRTAVVLRFFEGHSLREVGLALGLNENAANKRVDRALEKLRILLAKRGITTTASGLTAALAASAVLSAPEGLAASVAAEALAASTTTTSITTATFVGLLTLKTWLLLTGLATLLLLGLVWHPFHWVNPQRFRAVDLASYYNARTPHATLNLEGNTLAEFPTGTNRFGGIPFSVEGLIQIGNHDYTNWPTKFPPSVLGIKVAQQCRVLHLLHGTGLNAGTARPVIAFLELHYEGGKTATIPIIYGRHVRDWWFTKESSEPPDPGTEVAWRGSNPQAVSKGYRLRIYRSAFPNPMPDKRIESIDYVSTLTVCAPFMLGLTLEN